jgi:hypothetical protein
MLGADFRRDLLRRGAATLVSLLAAAPGVLALEPKAEEAKVLEDCDRRTCMMLVRKEPTGEDLKCDLTKTWAKSTIKGADSSAFSWGFGDARCSVHVEISRALIIAALTEKKYKLWIPPHTANCIVEQDGQLKTIKATLAPKIIFEHGKAEKIWINLIKMEGTSAITDLLWAAAKLEDSTGLFHGQMLKEVNKYIYTQCPKTLAHPPLADAIFKPKAKKPSSPPSNTAVPK